MAIETICRGCARKLRVGDEFAGRKARCPHCKTIYTVPAAIVDSDASSEPVADTSDNWLLRTSDGSVYGPVPKSELDGWVREGRLDATSQLQEEGEATWRQAAELYPALLRRVTSTVAPYSSGPISPTQAASPYTTPRAAGPLGRPFEPHRGVVILVFGLLGLLCCPIFAIVAWVMGHFDLKAINAGRIDPEGRGLTQAGMIIGIIGVANLVLSIFAYLIMAVMLISNT